MDGVCPVTLYFTHLASGGSVTQAIIAIENPDTRTPDAIKKVRNARNEIAHSDEPLDYDLCTEEDIDFVESFQERILSRTDPLALLRKQTIQVRQPSTTQPTTRNAKRQTNYTPQQESVGCLGLVVSALVVIACVVAYLI